MLTKADLPKLVRRTLKSLGGEATPVEVARVLWRDHRRDLKKSGDIFYTWQVDIRQAATALRRQGKMVPAADSPGIWRLIRKKDRVVAEKPAIKIVA